MVCVCQLPKVHFLRYELLKVQSVIAKKMIVSNTDKSKRVKKLTENRYMVSDIFPAIITKEIFDAVQAERARRSNIVTDETGTHRKSSHYSAKARKQ